MTIMHWNCQVYNSKFEEIKVLIKNKNPACICLQETYHGNRTPYPPSSYTLQAADPVIVYAPGVSPTRGVLTLFNNNYAHYKIRINFGREITICNIYITSGEHINGQQFQTLQQLPCILAGDFNARRFVQRDTERNLHGQVIEDLIRISDICILNNGSTMHLHKQTSTETCIDLAITSPDIFSELEWAPEEKTRGSDHWPCVISLANNIRGEANIIRFNLDKVNWKLFK